MRSHFLRERRAASADSGRHQSEAEFQHVSGSASPAPEQAALLRGRGEMKADRWIVHHPTAESKQGRGEMKKKKKWRFTPRDHILRRPPLSDPLTSFTLNFQQPAAALIRAVNLCRLVRSREVTTPRAAGWCPSLAEPAGSLLVLLRQTPESRFDVSPRSTLAARRLIKIICVCED